MFNNLIESSSHLGEFKRRGSFVLFTSATYVLLFIIAGVASIYAYDARLENQSTEFVTMLNPMDLPQAPAPTAHDTAPPRNHSNSPAVQTFREPPMATVNRPDIAPTTTSSTPNRNPPVPDGTRFVIGDHDSGPVEPSGTGRFATGGDGSGGTARTPVVDVGTPPPAQPPVENRVPRTVSRGPVNGLAIYLPKPIYSSIAKQARAAGAVNVQVLIDETGKVVSAKAVSGHPMLLPLAQQAAYGARFTPTTLGGQAVKVSGVITYNFILQ